ncbi:F0F1 ATP synthase subunit A [bacterium]|nr:F0F1 ATP synthase subunit A [bacterium]
MLDISLAPKALFYIAGFPVSNTFFWMVILSILLMIVFIWVARSMKSVPGPLQNILETLIEGSFNFANSITGSEKKTRKMFPFIFTLFIFIVVSNLVVYFPGQSALTIENAGGTIPLFRAIMSDYSLIFVMTISGVIVTQIIAISVHGPFGYIGKFINIKEFKNFIKLLFKGKFKPSLLAQGFLDLFLGIMDLVGEVSKIISLSFRLFGNIFAGEVIALVVLNLFPFILPLPFKFLGLLTAVVQAFVFSVLTLIYMTLASEMEGDEIAEKVTI